MKMIIHNPTLFWFTVGFAIVLLLTLCISVPVDGGANFYTTDTVFGLLIGHSLAGLSTYILLIAILFAASLEFTEKS